MEPTRDLVDVGAWIGRQQAFAVIANKCSAAQALSLKQVKETRLFEQLGLNWDEFCRDHAGISRTNADTLIRQLDEFGEAYFRLSEIARISPETFRHIADQVDDQGIEIDGEKLALIPDNAPRIRTAIRTLRAQLRQARAAQVQSNPGVTQFQIRLDALLEEVSRLIAPLMSEQDRSALRGLAAYAVSKWSRIARTLEDQSPRP